MYCVLERVKSLKSIWKTDEEEDRDTRTSYTTIFDSSCRQQVNFDV